MTDHLPIDLNYPDGEADLNIAALLGRGRRARRRRQVVVGTVSVTTAATLVGAGVAVATTTHSGHSETVSATTVPPNSPWTQTNGNAADSRSNLSESTLTASTVAKIKHLRTYTAPASEPACSTESVGAVLSGGDVTALVGGYLVKYVADTGHVIWRTPFSDGHASQLAVSDGEVIVGAEFCGTASDPEGTIDAYSQATGTFLWHSESVPDCQAGGASCSSAGDMAGLGIADGYIVSGGSTLASGSGVAVLKASDGSLVWEDTTSTCFISAPIVVHQQVIFSKCNASGAPRMVADAVRTGARTWQEPGAWQVQRGDFSQTRGHNVLAVDPAGAVVDVNPQNGKTLGALPGAVDVLAVDGLEAYATCATPGDAGAPSSVCAFSLTSRKLLWRSGSPADTTLATEAGAVLYLNTGAMLNARTGASLGAAFHPGSEVVRGLSVGDGRLALVTDTTSELYGLKGE
jgi:hypothetical protein